MFKLLRKMKGQSTLEYAVLIIIIIGALLSIQVYIKRGVQGRLKSATDDIGDQFDPGNTKANKSTMTKGRTFETFDKGISRSEMATNETTLINQDSTIINVDQTFWGK